MTYVARSQDVTAGGILIATAIDTGVIHQNVTDSQGGGNQGLNIKVIVTPPPAPVTSPPPVGGGGTGGGTLPPPSVPIVPPVPPTPPVTTSSGGGGGNSTIPVTPPVVVHPVTVPILPNTGFPPQENTMWNDIMLAGVFALIIMPLAVLRKKV